MSERLCITHHAACPCREAQRDRERAAADALAEAAAQYAPALPLVSTRRLEALIAAYRTARSEP